MAIEPYEVYAIRYAHHERNASANFLGGNPHDGPMPLDYFLWAIKGNGGWFVVDTGFDEVMARKRGRKFLLKPEDGLRSIGIRHDKAEDVIFTHLHHNHCGTHHLLPNARFHVQERLLRHAQNQCPLRDIGRRPTDGIFSYPQ